MSIAELLKETRSKKGLSQEEAANALHVSQAYYSRIERGLKEPDETMLKSIGEFSGLSNEEIKAIYSLSTEAQKPETVQQADTDKKGKETVWLNEFRQVVFLFLLILSIPYPICAWLAIYWAHRSKFRKWVVVAVAIFAFALTFFYLNQMYFILPPRTWYEFEPLVE